MDAELLHQLEQRARHMPEQVRQEEIGVYDRLISVGVMTGDQREHLIDLLGESERLHPTQQGLKF